MILQLTVKLKREVYTPPYMLVKQMPRNVLQIASDIACFRIPSSLHRENCGFPSQVQTSKFWLRFLPSTFKIFKLQAYTFKCSEFTLCGNQSWVSHSGHILTWMQIVIGTIGVKTEKQRENLKKSADKESSSEQTTRMLRPANNAVKQMYASSSRMFSE